MRSGTETDAPRGVSTLLEYQAGLPERLEARRGRGGRSNQTRALRTETTARFPDEWLGRAGSAPPSRLTDGLTKKRPARRSYVQQVARHLVRTGPIIPIGGCEHGCNLLFRPPQPRLWRTFGGARFRKQALHQVQRGRTSCTRMSRPGYMGAPIALGVNTDAYQAG